MVRPTKPSGAKKPRARREAAAAAEPGSRGLATADVAASLPPDDVADLCARIAADGGAVVGAYRDPLGGVGTVLAALPIDLVEPTPFQRDLSATHVDRLAGVLIALGRYLDPVIAVRAAERKYWTPNGGHRLAAMKKIGARAITALVVPDMVIARRILALNTEKAHNLREKSMEVIRLYRVLDPSASEIDCALELEEGAFVTLGLCYEKKPRISGGAYHPVLRRVDELLDVPLGDAMRTREARAEAVLALDVAVGEAVEKLRAQGMQSPYLRAFVVARCNPLRFLRGKTMPFDETIEKMTAAAREFDAGKIKAADLAGAGVPPESAE